MKNLLSFAPSKILIACGVSLFVTLGGFWHYKLNQKQLDRLDVLNQGVTTCWGRISQTFTAMMIKDIKSPYLDRGFMGLSDECLNEAIEGVNPFKKDIGRGFETLNKLLSEVHWFHEKITKIHTPMLVGQAPASSLTSLSDRFSKMENFKLNLVDEIEATNVRIKRVLINDEFAIGAGLLMFVIGLTLLSIQEYNRLQLRRETENEALNLLNIGRANVGALVDNLVDKAFSRNDLPVARQVFRDYHADLLERLAARNFVPQTLNNSKIDEQVISSDEIAEVVSNTPKTSLKEVLVSLQNIHSSDVISTSDVREVQLAVEYESCQQMLNAAVNKLLEKRSNNKKIMISNQIHSDKTIINLFLAGNHFQASELEYLDSQGALHADSADMNMMILKEMASEADAGLFIENKSDKNGKISGMSLRLTIKRVPKEKAKLVSLIKGKKRDLSRAFVN